jgi:hypothetical protein
LQDAFFDRDDGDRGGISEVSHIVEVVRHFATATATATATPTTAAATPTARRRGGRGSVVQDQP